jgi:hypothetical protein
MIARRDHLGGRLSRDRGGIGGSRTAHSASVKPDMVKLSLVRLFPCACLGQAFGPTILEGTKACAGSFGYQGGDVMTKQGRESGEIEAARHDPVCTPAASQSNNQLR